MQNKQCVVITYSGAEAPDNVIEKMLKTMNCVIEDNTNINISKFSAEDVNAIIGTFVLNKEQQKDDDPIKSACILIGTTYFSQLKCAEEKTRATKFLCKLSVDLIEAKYKKNNPALINAVNILGKHTPSEELCKKYGFTKEILDIIKHLAKM